MSISIRVGVLVDAEGFFSSWHANGQKEEESTSRNGEAVRGTKKGDEKGNPK